MKITAAVFLCFLFASLSGFSQKAGFDYQPSNLDSLKNYISTVTKKKELAFEGKHQKEISKILSERKERFIKNINDSSYIFDKRINKYLKSILREIYTANRDLNTTDYYFFIDKSPVPNAACYGNGVFTVNLGLLELMGSDDEIAFVICHEIAHMVLKHNDASLLTHVETLNSKDVKKKITKASGQRYGRRQAFADVMKDLSYNFQKRSRNAEMQADSLGYVYFSKTKYDKAAAAAALKKLDLTDAMLFTTDTQIRKQFTFETYPFKEVWLEGDETLFDLKESANDLAFDKDSLKTHPDIPYRITKLGLPPVEIPTGSELLSVKKVVAENNVAISLDASRLDLALYQILAQREKNEVGTPVYCNVVAKLLKRTYELKATHKFGKYVSPVSPFDDEKYLNEVRVFLHNMEMKNLRKIGLLFCQKYSEEMKGDADFEALTAYFTKLNT